MWHYTFVIQIMVFFWQLLSYLCSSMEKCAVFKYNSLHLRCCYIFSLNLTKIVKRKSSYRLHISNIFHLDSPIWSCRSCTLSLTIYKYYKHDGFKMLKKTSLPPKNVQHMLSLLQFIIFCADKDFQGALCITVRKLDIFN